MTEPKPVLWNVNIKEDPSWEHLVHQLKRLRQLVDDDELLSAFLDSTFYLYGETRP